MAVSRSDWFHSYRMFHPIAPYLRRSYTVVMCVRTCRHTCMHACMLTNTHAYMHAYMHICVHQKYQHSKTHANTQMYMVYLDTGVEEGEPEKELFPGAGFGRVTSAAVADACTTLLDRIEVVDLCLRQVLVCALEVRPQTFVDNICVYIYI